jgi:hypothetical protein
MVLTLNSLRTVILVTELLKYNFFYIYIKIGSVGSAFEEKHPSLSEVPENILLVLTIH